MPEFDLDEIFAYKLSRRVVIRHRLLGLTRWVIILALIGYVFVFEVIWKKGYLKKDEPLGFATLSLRRSDWDDISKQKQCCPAAGCGICSGGVGCEAWTTSGACTTEGCNWEATSRLTAFSSERGRLECVEWDRYGVLKPYSEEYSSTITTRVTHVVSQELPMACIMNTTSTDCPAWEAASVTSYYVTGVEDMTLLVDHGVYGRESEKIVRAQQMDTGIIHDSNGDNLYTLCGNGKDDGRATPVGDVSTTSCNDQEATRRGDIISVQQLLTAAGVDDLDVLSVDERSEATDTRRYDGIVLLVVIMYDGSGVDTQLEYTYRVFPLHGLDYKFEEVMYQWLPNGNVARHVLNRHGVRIILTTSGYVTEFSFAELVKTMMIAMGLLSAAKFVVEFIILRLHPNAGIYARYRDVKTVDFSDYTTDELHMKLSDTDYALGTVRNGTAEANEPKLGEKIHARLEALKGDSSDSDSYGDEDDGKKQPKNKKDNHGQGSAPAGANTGLTATTPPAPAGLHRYEATPAGQGQPGQPGAHHPSPQEVNAAVDNYYSPPRTGLPHPLTASGRFGAPPPAAGSPSTAGVPYQVLEDRLPHGQPVYSYRPTFASPAAPSPQQPGGGSVRPSVYTGGRVGTL